MVAVTERFISIGVIVTLLIFLAFNYDLTIGVAFSAMAFASILLSMKDKKVSIPIQRDSILTSFVRGVIATLIFFGIASVVLPSIRSLNLSSIIDLYASASSPFFAESTFFTVIAFGLVIAYVESDFFFAKLPEVITDAFNIRWDLKNPRFIGVILAIVAIFALFHITAKYGQQAQFDESMALVSIFAGVSMVLVYYTRQVLDAIFMHIIVNSSSVLATYGVIPSSYILFGGVAIALVAVAFAKQFNIKITRSAS